MQRQGFPRLFNHSEEEGEGRCEAAIDSEERTDGEEGRSIPSSQMDLVLKNWETGRPLERVGKKKRRREERREEETGRSSPEGHQQTQHRKRLGGRGVPRARTPSLGATQNRHTNERFSISNKILLHLYPCAATKVFSGLVNGSGGLEEPLSAVVSWETNTHIGRICFKETVSNTGLSNN
ncbi:hypothetical protein LXL04_017083 [Taraxacum kok-saghyz]